MVRFLLIFSLIAFSSALSSPFAHAQVEDPVFKLEPSQSLLHISATERRDVDQDLLVATLRIESENPDSSYVQNIVNKAMAGALDEAKKYKDVKAITRAYTVNSYDRNRGKRGMSVNIVWKAQQSVELKSTNSEELLELAGKIQNHGFVMAGLNYMLSPARAAEIQDEMLEAALEKLQTRAKRAALALGKKTAELKEINTQGNSARQPIQRAYARMEMAQSAEIAAPIASAGETTIMLNVSAKALLK